MGPLAVLGALPGIAVGVAIVTASPEPFLVLVVLTVGLRILATARRTSARR
ncbi:hypothetical protein [Actinomycetospora sp. TBRC 11914]|uniref:hypothetical protein n=1 Tax=Actinomycetospora sp. TBRC 11914 TaxID=2729387 RepID=UPI00145C5668|nr:hypothetical protein [Actinomycetospora sp. TBRC 11914]NMO88221.1 hypothetical protein [Actinomycetospora sp. TBRC 11914]